MRLRSTAVCLAVTILTGASGIARSNEAVSHGLQGITTVSVVVDVNDDVRELGLTEGLIEGDVKLKLRRAGMRVVTTRDILTITGSPSLYVSVTSLASQAATVQVQLEQNAHLERNSEFVAGVTTWETTFVIANPTVQGIRMTVNSGIDKFLRATSTESMRKDAPSGRPLSHHFAHIRT